MTPLSFSAFAERCEQFEYIGPHNDAPFLIGQAARHARLLERIEQWALNDPPKGEPMATLHEITARQRPDITDTLSAAKAEVLRLLREEK